MNVAIIPARGGSKRIPRKNIKEFFGKPIIAYSIEAVRNIDLFDSVIVSTDDGEIAEIATQMHAKVFWRQFEVDWDTTNAGERGINGLRKVHYKPFGDDGSKGTQEVAADVLVTLPKVDYACVVYATAPLLCRASIVDGFFAVNDPRVNFAFGVGTEPLRDAGQFYWGSRQAFLLKQPLYAPFTVMIPVDEYRVCDINTPEDWDRAERMHARFEEAKKAVDVLEKYYKSRDSALFRFNELIYADKPLEQAQAIIERAERLIEQNGLKPRHLR